MQIKGEQSITINGKDYWTIKQFAYLTNRGDTAIYILVTKGNRIRKLKTLTIDHKRYIEAQELFDFPFVVIGRPGDKDIIPVEKFVLKNDTLEIKEDIFTTLS